MTGRAWACAMASLVAAMPLAAQKPAERRCLLQVDSIGREGLRDETIPGNVNYFGGGGVWMHCIDQGVFLDADSLESFGGQYVRLLGRAKYRDSDVTIDADTLIYTKNDERLQARVNVHIVNRVNGSTLDGPYVDYLRAVKGVRDSAETIAMQRPTVTYHVARAPGDTVDPAPYVIVGDGLRGYGGSRLTGWGNVTVDRDSLAGRGDSLRYDRGDRDVAILVGQLASLVRRGSDSFTVRGRQVELALEGEALRGVRALGQGHVVGAAGEIIADSTALAFEAGELVQTLAWDRANRAQVLAQGYDVRGDSVAIDTPRERLRELRVFQRGSLVEPEDTTAAPAAPDSAATADGDSSAAPGESIRNRMAGNRITARFVDRDSAGTTQTRLVDIVAIGSATSLFAREVERDGRTSPTINYTRADTIIVVMKTGDSSGVEEVRAFGHVDGVQLERESLRKRRPAPTAREARREGEP